MKKTNGSIQQRKAEKLLTGLKKDSLPKKVILQKEQFAAKVGVPESDLLKIAIPSALSVILAVIGLFLGVLPVKLTGWAFIWAFGTGGSVVSFPIWGPILVAMAIALAGVSFASIISKIYNYGKTKRIPANFKSPLSKVGSFCAEIVFLPAVILLRKDKKTQQEINEILRVHFDDWGYNPYYCEALIKQWGNDSLIEKYSRGMFRSMCNKDLIKKMPGKELLTDTFWENAFSVFQEVYRKTSKRKEVDDYYQFMIPIFTKREFPDECSKSKPVMSIEKWLKQYTWFTDTLPDKVKALLPGPLKRKQK